MSKGGRPFEAVNLAVLTISDTRTTENDTSGDYLAEQASAAGHKVLARDIIIDDIYKIRAKVSALIADESVQAILITGGTGFTQRDSTPEALTPLFDKQIEGFGELFRYISYKEIGTSTVQSRAIAGMANKTIIFCMPGSTGACKTAWEGILKEQLDSTHKPCNFAPHI
ncbi:molybdenum cofactor biosynthesis protein B [Glaciecola sp. XM2]|jgi:molybdenum cofactor biosynthesis protein B|uniref:molybdenum cofactor biosynthesis protein B n=1 Tax=Glaciecola sp. XM2 TaxID=1914931 RepID=UPI001BDDFCEC|nr:molybdenum cofactor biosynthesis protein B [Glaciecola sp. XM2]MBT1450015.1 molybdenum cofactor biosynthesis protein B [Glaciecola sp. XM2]